MEDTRTDYEKAAYEFGCEHARNAASWVMDGNTTEEHVRRVLAMMDDGDPEAWDYLPPAPNLSGEMAGAPTPQSIAEEIGAEECSPEERDALCDAYEEGVSETFEPECERILRESL